MFPVRKRLEPQHGAGNNISKVGKHCLVPDGLEWRQGGLLVRTRAKRSNVPCQVWRIVGTLIKCPTAFGREFVLNFVIGIHESHDLFDLMGKRPAPLVKSPLSSLRPSPRRARTPSTQGGPACRWRAGRCHVRRRICRGRRGQDACHLHHAVQHLAIVDADDEIAAEPRVSKTSASMAQISASAATVGVPTVSASH